MRDQTYYDNLVAKNQIEKILDELMIDAKASESIRLYDTVILLSGRYNRNQQQNNSGFLATADYNRELNKITAALKECISEYFSNVNPPLRSEPSEDPKDLNIKNQVFISYNHRDKSIANKIKLSLEQVGITVKIDSSDMTAGQDIRDFINQSIKDTSVTLSVVSTNSLLSSWVSLETSHSIVGEAIANKKFIGAYIDDSFFSRSFVDNALDQVEKEVNDIQAAIKRRVDKNRNIDDLNSELKRFSDLVHNLPSIVDRLRKSLTIDITSSNYKSGIQKIIEAIIA